MGFESFTLRARGIRVELDVGLGQLSRFEVEREGRTVAPFHRAPWADEPGPVAGTGEAPHLARLSGDFFCAPFSTADVEPAPPHGWTANASWRALGARSAGNGVTASFVLERPVMGARVVKELTLRDGHPFLYQRHVFEAGAGDIPVANHAMVGLPNGGNLSFSPKRWAETPDTPLEPDPARGRSVLACPARSTDLAAFPLAAGGTVDLTAYPVADRHEDFVMLVEAGEEALGWSAVARPAEGDLVLTLKDPRRLPVTMLWFSNGGRDYAPWNGRHRGVLGIEDGCAWSLHGHAASIAPNPLAAAGIATAIRLDPEGSVDIRHVIGAVPAPAGFGEVRAVRAEGGGLSVEGAAGAALYLPFDADFLSGGR